MQSKYMYKKYIQLWCYKSKNKISGLYKKFIYILVAVTLAITFRKNIYQDNYF